MISVPSITNVAAWELPVQNIMVSGTDIWVWAGKDQPYPAVAALEIARKMKTERRRAFSMGKELRSFGEDWRCWERGGRVVKAVSA